MRHGFPFKKKRHFQAFFGYLFANKTKICFFAVSKHNFNINFTIFISKFCGGAVAVFFDTFFRPVAFQVNPFCFKQINSWNIFTFGVCDRFKQNFCAN
nr:MAG TPA: hypothetical protein [Caudoviricetes sp.]